MSISFLYMPQISSMSVSFLCSPKIPPMNVSLHCSPKIPPLSVSLLHLPRPLQCHLMTQTQKLRPHRHSQAVKSQMKLPVVIGQYQSTKSHFLLFGFQFSKMFKIIFGLYFLIFKIILDLYSQTFKIILTLYFHMFKILLALYLQKEFANCIPF